MPKIKTNRSAAKRLKRTGSGKLMRNRMGRRHILTTKPSKRKRHMRKQTEVAPGMMKRMNVLVPYLDNN
jgi:large subunit ribosomal protein L35